jgi:hypothetical protein
MEDTNKLEVIALQILKANPNALLSGSLALNLQGLKTKRVPSDVDIYLPWGQKFEKIENMVTRDLEEDYDNEDYQIFQYMVSGVKVDVFTPMHDSVPELEVRKVFVCRCVQFSDILKFKIKHSLNGSSTSWKHKHDLIYIFVVNDKI